MISNNFFIKDLLAGLKEDTLNGSYYFLIDFKQDIKEFLKKNKIKRVEQFTKDIENKMRDNFEGNVASMFHYYINSYTFDMKKLIYGNTYVENELYDDYIRLIRLPKMSKNDADLYFNAGVIFKVLLKNKPEKVQSIILKYITDNKLKTTIPSIKEIKIQKIVAKAILHADKIDAKLEKKRKKKNK